MMKNSKFEIRNSKYLSRRARISLGFAHSIQVLTRHPPLDRFEFRISDFEFTP